MVPLAVDSHNKGSMRISSRLLVFRCFHLLIQLAEEPGAFMSRRRRAEQRRSRGEKDDAMVRGG